MQQTKPILTHEDLANHSLRELRQIVTDYKGSWHERETKADIIERICELSIIVQPDEKDSRVREQKAAEAQKDAEAKKEPLEPPKPLEHADILEAVKLNIEAGLLIKFDAETWSMRFRDRTDSGTLKMPIRAIKRCADMLVRPGVLPPSPPCRSCREPTVWEEGRGYICKNPECSKHVKPANPDIPDRNPLSVTHMV